MDIIEEYKDYCKDWGVGFSNIELPKSYDETTLFCPAGMQQFKGKFKDKGYKGTVANNQACIRLIDFENLGDGTHLAYFNMLGLFSFRDWSVRRGVKFWLGFMDRVGIKPTRFTIHPDKKDWKKYYSGKVVLDKECRWSDGEIGGYCTEFFFEEIELGNIVNPLGDCLDCGFGFERIDQIVNKTKPLDRNETLKACALKIYEVGYRPSNKKQGYVLRRIIRELYKTGIIIPKLSGEVARQQEIRNHYLKIKDKYPNKNRDWWMETHGIDIDTI